MPGAISTQSDAWPGTGRKPREVFPMNVASCGWSASRNVYVRRVIPIAGGHAITALSRESTHGASFRAVPDAHAAGAIPALSASASAVSAVSGFGIRRGPRDRAVDRSRAARVDTTRGDRKVRRMNHPSRAATLAALTAVLALAGARDAAA